MCAASSVSSRFKLVGFKRFDDEAAYQDSLAIRRTVFVDEQGASADTEPDLDDNEYTLYWNLQDTETGQAVATGRMFPDGADTNALRIGRMAVLKEYRGLGLGRRVLYGMMETAQALKQFNTFVLDAQEYAAGFYAQVGFQSLGQRQMLEGIPHYAMTRSILLESV